MRSASAVACGWRRFAAAIAAVIIAAAGSAEAAPGPSVACPTLAKDGSVFLSLDQMDSRIVAELQRRFAQGQAYDISQLIAPRDGDWQATDVIMPGPMLPGRRFLQGGRVGDTWYVWYQTGGIAIMFHAAIFELPHAAEQPRLRAHTAGRLDDLCPFTMAQLAGRGPAGQPYDFW